MRAFLIIRTGVGLWLEHNAFLLVVLMWVYFSALLLLLGAALTRAQMNVRAHPRAHRMGKR